MLPCLGTTPGQASCSPHLHPGVQLMRLLPWNSGARMPGASSPSGATVCLTTAGAKEDTPFPGRSPSPEPPGPYSSGLDLLSGSLLFPALLCPPSIMTHPRVPTSPRPTSPETLLLYHQVWCHLCLLIHGFTSAYTTIQTTNILNPLFLHPAFAPLTTPSHPFTMCLKGIISTLLSLGFLIHQKLVSAPKLMNNFSQWVTGGPPLLILCLLCSLCLHLISTSFATVMLPLG